MTETAKVFIFLGLFVFTLSMCGYPQEHGKTLLIIKQNDFEPIPTIIKNVRNELAKNYPTLNIQEVTIKGEEDAIAITNKTNPNIIFLVGADIGKTLANNIKDTPIVISDMFKPEYARTFPSDRFIINSLYIPTETRLAYTQKILPGIKTIAIIYNPAKNSDVINDAEKYAQAHAITVKRFPVENEKDIQLIDHLNTSALLLIPDSLVCSIVSLRHIIGKCVAEQIPIIGISEYFAQTGTVAAISTDFNAYSLQAASSIIALLNKMPPSAVPSTSPEKVDYFINAAMAKTKNVQITDEILKGAKKVFGQ